MFAPVCEEAATLVLAGEHLVDFVDFDISDIVFLCEAECASVVVVLEDVSECGAKHSAAVGTVREVCKDAEEKCDEIYFG